VLPRLLEVPPLLVLPPRPASLPLALPPLPEVPPLQVLPPQQASLQLVLPPLLGVLQLRVLPPLPASLPLVLPPLPASPRLVPPPLPASLPLALPLRVPPWTASLLTERYPTCPTLWPPRASPWPSGANPHSPLQLALPEVLL